MRLGQNEAMHVDAIPTGSLSVIWRWESEACPEAESWRFMAQSSGKTTWRFTVSRKDKSGGYTAFIDVEHALDPVYARALGVDVDFPAGSQPDTGEQALEITEALVRSGAIDVIVVDSAGLGAPRGNRGGNGDSHVGLQARLASQALRKLAGAISKSNCVAIFINQLREKVGVMYGNPEVTPGGRALKFYSSVRIDIRRIETLKAGGEMIGSRTRAKVVKNKIAPPFREAEFDVMYGRGISREGELLDLAVKLDVVQKSGAWFSFNGERLGQGRDNVKEYFRSHPDFAAKIEKQVYDNAGKLYAKTAPVPAAAAEPDKSVAKPVEAEVKAAPKKSKASIDIMVDD